MLGLLGLGGHLPIKLLLLIHLYKGIIYPLKNLVIFSHPSSFPPTEKKSSQQHTILLTVNSPFPPLPPPTTPSPPLSPPPPKNHFGHYLLWMLKFLMLEVMMKMLFFNILVCLFVYLFICLFVYLFICLFVYLFICLFVYLFICLFVYLFIYLFVAKQKLSFLFISHLPLQPKIMNMMSANMVLGGYWHIIERWQWL